MTESEKINKLKKYMKEMFQVTPENIDEELQKLRLEIKERRRTNGKYQRV